MPKLWQYKGTVGPVDTTFGERITVDKWKPQLEMPVQAKRMPVAVMAASLAFVPVVAEGEITVDKWFQRTAEPVWRVPPRPPTFPVLQTTQFAEVITVDKWQPRTNQPWLQRYNVEYRYPSLFFFSPAAISGLVGTKGFTEDFPMIDGAVRSFPMIFAEQ